MVSHINAYTMVSFHLPKKPVGDKGEHGEISAVNKGDMGGLFSS